VLRTAADGIEVAGEFVQGNVSVSARLRAIVEELRFTADAFEGDQHAKA